MESYYGSPSRGRIKIYGTFQVFDTGSNIFEADAFKVVFICCIEALAVVLYSTANAVFVTNKRNV